MSFPQRSIPPRRWRHQPAAPSPDSEPLRISSFRDAISTAFAIADRFKHAHATVALDEKGIVVNFICFTAKHHSIETALAWADYLAHDEPRFKLLLLLTAGEEGVSVLSEEDVELFQRAGRIWSERSIPLVDWLKCDREAVRSLAFSSGLEASYELIRDS